METLRKVFTLISIFPTSATEKWQIKLRNISIFAMQIILLFLSLDFFIKICLIDLESALYALLQIVGLICTIYSIVVGYFQRSNIERLFRDFHAICIECKKILCFHCHDIHMFPSTQSLRSLLKKRANELNLSQRFSQYISHLDGTRRIY